MKKKEEKTLEEFLQEKQEPIPVEQGIVSEGQQAMESIRAIENKLLEDAMQVVEGGMAFKEIDPSDEEPPAEWIMQLGTEEAWKRFRLARAAWLPQKDAPMGFKVASGVMTSILRARAGSGHQPRSLNVAAQINYHPSKLPEKSVDD